MYLSIVTINESKSFCLTIDNVSSIPILKILKKILGELKLEEKEIKVVFNKKITNDLAIFDEFLVLNMFLIILKIMDLILSQYLF